MSATTKTWPKKWAGKRWRGTTGGRNPWVLTDRELIAFYAAISQGKSAMCEALGVPGLQHRKADRALALLKSEKLIWFNPETKSWEQSE